MGEIDYEVEYNNRARVPENPVLMAGSLLACLPVIAVFVVLQRQFVEGIAFSGSKG